MLGAVERPLLLLVSEATCWFLIIGKRELDYLPTENITHDCFLSRKP